MNLDDLERQLRQIRWPLKMPVLRSEVLAIIAAARERDALREQVRQFWVDMENGWDRRDATVAALVDDLHATALDHVAALEVVGAKIEETVTLECEVERLRSELADARRLGASVDTAVMTPTADTDGHTGGRPIRTEQPYGKGGAR